MPDGLSTEDAKLFTLARAARARVGAAEGAAVRDGDGRTYATANVALPSLTLSALQLAVANAVAAGARTLEAAVVISAVDTGSVVDDASSVDASSSLDDPGRAAVADLNADAPVYSAAP